MSRRPLLLAALVSAGSLAGCSLVPGSSSAGSSPNAKPRVPEPTASSATPSPAAAASLAPSTVTTATATDGALAGWSLEEKVDQLVVVGVGAQAPKQSFNKAINAYHVSNTFAAGRTTAGSQTTQKVISSFTSKVDPNTTRTTPVLVAIGREGGEVRILAGSGFSDIPSALDQSAQPRDQLVTSARTWGKELADIDVNVNLAPIADLVDIARPTSNEPIGRWGREYRRDAATVSSWVGAFAEGIQTSKIIPTYKHFPGPGWVKDNADTSAGVVDSATTRSADTTVSVIFGTAIAAGVPVIIVSSVTYFLIDPSAPAVFSSTIVTDILRREMGFPRVITTDDVSATVQVQDVNAGDRAVWTVQTGYSVMLVSADPTMAADMIKTLISTARSDPVFAARMNESATWVLNPKKGLQL